MSLATNPMMMGGGVEEGLFRYWRVRIISGHTPTTGNNIGIRDIDFLDAPGGTSLVGSGTAFGTPPIAGSLANLFDGSSTTSARWDGVFPIIAGYDFGMAVEPGALTLNPLVGTSTAAPMEMFVEGSHDQSNWVESLHIHWGPSAAITSEYVLPLPDVTDASQIWSGSVDQNFIVPDDVFFANFALVGMGGAAASNPSGGGSGELAWANWVPVTPGETLRITPQDISGNGACAIRRGGTVLMQVLRGGDATGTSGGAGAPANNGVYPAAEGDVDSFAGQAGGGATNTRGGDCVWQGCPTPGGHTNGRGYGVTHSPSFVTVGTAQNLGVGFGWGGSTSSGVGDPGGAGMVLISWGTYRHWFILGNGADPTIAY